MAKNLVKSKPVVPSAYDLYLDAFYKLNSERQISENHVGSIPLTKIMEYGQWLDVINMKSFIETIMQIDAAYVNYVVSEMRKEIQRASRGNNGKYLYT